MIAPKIMVVEDEEPLCVLLKYNLEAEGYQVEIVNRGDEAEIHGNHDSGAGGLPVGETTPHLDDSGVDLA